jgi:PmbA protein
MSNEQLVLDAAEVAVKAAISGGAEWADATAVAGRSISVSTERNTVRESEVGYYRGVGVRAFVKGGVGLAHSASLERAAARRIGEQAAQLARAASPDPDFKCLPDPMPVPHEPEIFDEKVAGLPAEQLVKWCVEAIERGRAAAEHVYISGGAHAGWGVRALASSTGIALTTRGSAVGIYVSASVWDEGEAASFGDGTDAVRLADLKWEDLPHTAVHTAAKLLHDKPVTTGRCDVVIDFKPAYWWLRYLVSCADGESVQRKRSFMVGREGEKIASSVLTIVEDPFIPWGSWSAGFDGEGVPKQRRRLVDAGVLTTYLHNSYTANKAGVLPTGHAIRSRYNADVGIGISNLLVQPGEKCFQELISEVEEGIFVISGGPYPNRVTGQVSSTIDGGFVISKGELGNPVKGAMLAGDIFEFLDHIDVVSSDFREEPGRVMPAIRIRDVLVSAE